MANYPTSASTDANLYVQVNNKTTILTAGITNSDTTIPVSSTTGFPATGTVTVDLEIISYTSLDATNFLGATRGFDGSSAVSHLSGALVSHNIIAKHHNNSKDEIIAVETDLVGVQAALAPTAPTSLATSILNRFNQLAQRFIDLTGLTNWYDAFVSFPVSKGGTGNTTLTAGGYLKGAGTSPVTVQITPIPVADGGTNSGTALTNNKVIRSTSGAFVESAIGISSAKLTSLDAGTVAGDSVRYEQLFYGFQAPVQATTTSTFTTTSATYQTTNLSATITPTSATHRIKITVSASIDTLGTGTSGIASLFRDSTDLSGAAAGGFGQISINATQPHVVPIAMTYIDSPATTSPITYSVKLLSSGGGSVQFGAGSIQVLTLEEIV